MIAVMQRPPGTPSPAPRPARRRLPPLVAGSVTAKALAALWGGEPVVVVESPPGAGKTTLVCVVASHLGARARLRIAVATQTNAQAVDLANRLAAAASACPLTLLVRSGARRPRGLRPDVEFAERPRDLSDGIVVATAARWAWIPPATWGADLLVVDEAWQLTWADFGAIAPVAPQALLVGDPGQIAPVTTGDTSRWAHYRAAPHAPAPQALGAVVGEQVTHLRLPATCRLGPATTALLQPLYGFRFASARPPRAYYAPGAVSASPEVSLRGVVSHGGTDDPAVADAVAARVRELVGGRVVEADGTARTVADADVGVICAHVSQVAAVAARLGDHPGVMVDTTERHQGLEHEVSVLWLPLAGARALSGFALDTGRLCVGLSRHRCHLSVVTRHDTRAILDAAGAATDPAAAARYGAVLDAIEALGAEGSVGRRPSSCG